MKNWLAPVVVALVAWAAPARASVSIPLSPGELDAASFAKCVVTPIDATSTWEDGRIVTYTRVHVDRVLSGSAPDEVTIRTLGGVVGDVGQIVFGEAVLAPHATVHLSSFRGATVVTGGEQGEVTATDAHAAFCRTTTVTQDPSFVPTASQPCWTEGIPLAWKHLPIEYAINQGASTQVSLAQIESAMTTAFAQWSDAECIGGKTSLDVRFSSPTSARTSKLDRVNVVMFDDGKWPHPNAASTLALTTVTYDPQTGEILDADLEINSANEKLTVSGAVPPGGYDLESIVTHEAGHFIGFAHSPDPKATMYATYTPGSTSMRTLSANDITGVCTVYPPSTGACSTAPSAPDASWLLIVALYKRRKPRESRA